jgi:hypothetical protein
MILDGIAQTVKGNFTLQRVKRTGSRPTSVHCHQERVDKRKFTGGGSLGCQRGKDGDLLLSGG